MIVVLAASNEGLQLERVDWEQGTISENLTSQIMGNHYQNLISNTGYNDDFLGLTNIFDQIPQLQGRVILVGNLHKDGITITPSSSLPGSFPNDFIFAPGEDIPTLGSTYLGKRMITGKTTSEIYESENNRQRSSREENESTTEDIYSEIGSFGGTSGAAPPCFRCICYLKKIIT